jgi:putative hydrolase of the HAD superfamily
MSLIALDLDDTLMWCKQDYDAAKQQFGAYMEVEYGVAASHAVEELEQTSLENVERFGVSMQRFPASFVETYQKLTGENDPMETAHLYGMGATVFKTEDEYAERGLLDGARDVLETLAAHGFEMHLITAGDSRIQQLKIDGLGIGPYFEETHIVPHATKDVQLRRIMQTKGYTPENTFMIGNSLSSDIVPAVNVGARAVFLPNGDWLPTDDIAHYADHDRVTVYESLWHLYEDSPDLFFA